MSRISVSLLGGFAVTSSSGAPLHLPTRKAEALLAYLTFRPGQLHPRDKLASLLWGDVPDTQARASLRQTLSLVGKALAASPVECLVAEGRTIALAEGAVDVDVLRFEAAVAQGSPDALERAMELYRGDLLEGLVVDEAGFETWLLTERERLREIAVEALARLVAHHQTPRGSAERAIQAGVRLLALDPCQESVHRALMRLYVRQGRHAAALRQYQVCVAAVRRELDTEPESETKRVYRELLERRTAAATVEDDVPGVPGVPVEIHARETPLIGRESELARLVAEAEEAWAGRGRVAVVLGEAGIGKTRLIEELAAVVAGRGARVLIGRCYETEQILPLAPWVDAVRGGGLAADPRVHEALPPAVRRPLARVLPEIASTPAARDAENPLLLFQAFATLFGAAAGQAPLLVLLEDLHWADDMSLRFLAFLARRLGEQRVLVLGTAREEALADAPSLGRTLDELRGLSGFTALSLPPLSSEATGELVRALARTGSDAQLVAGFVEQVLRVSDGNPFVATETTRALQEGGAPSGVSVVPGTVREIISRRLDRLSGLARQVLTVAAVAGGILNVRLLQRAAGLGGSETADALEELVRQRVLEGAGDGFDFIHDRVRQVAEAALLAPRRAAVHAAIGEALEVLNADAPARVYDRRAHHFAQTDDAAKAVKYLGLFATSATDSGAHGEGIAAIDRALGLVPRLPAAAQEAVRLDLVYGKGRALLYSGQFAAALDVLGKDEAAVQAPGDARRTSLHHFLLAAACMYTADPAGSVRHARRALEEAGRIEDFATMGRARWILAMESFFGVAAEGVEHGEEAVRLLAKSDDRLWLGQAHWILGLNLANCGRVEEALTHETRARALGEAVGDRRLIAFTFGATGVALAARDDFAAAIEAGRQAVALAADPLYATTSRILLARTYLATNDVAAARPLLDEALPRARTFRHTRLEALIVALQAHVAFLEGDLAAARQRAEEGLELGRTSAHVAAIARAQHVLARVARAAGDEAAALAHLREAIASLVAIGAAGDEARALLDLADLLRARGEAAAAADAVSRAHRLFIDLGLTALAAGVERLRA